jgi:hypothetical protein
MPGGDRTGPLGEGPMTGRQLGFGAGFNAPGYMQKFGFGRIGGRGRGFGQGFGFRNRYYNQNASVESSRPELNQIQEEVNILKNSLNSILERLENLNDKETKTK